jgi:alpha-ketoglutarate-dependent taurine dioxygenase
MKSTDGVAAGFPTGGGLGAEIRGMDLRRLGDATFGAIHRAWLGHLVLLFRRQALTDADLIAFSRRFGELDLAPIQETVRRFVEGMPELYVVPGKSAVVLPLGVKLLCRVKLNVPAGANAASYTWISSVWASM